MRKLAGALGSAVLLAVLGAAPAQAQNGSCSFKVSVTHNRTETIETILQNGCRYFTWSWGVFNDPGAPTQHDGVGTRSGQSIAYDPESNGNVYGGYKYFNAAGKKITVDTY